MPLIEIIQNLIHKLEVGVGPRVFKVAALLLAIVALMMRYDAHAYRNLATPEGMDAAQLARNISEGKGYTTLLIRPLSLALVQKRSGAGTPPARTNTNFDPAQIKTAHPDLANPPVYPVLLAGLMKVLPFHYAVDLKKPFWSDNGAFSRYQPDFLIAVFNQILLVAAAVLTFFLARKLFDAGVAWLSAILLMGSELLWRFSVSGLPTMLLLVIFLGLVWCILKIQETIRQEEGLLLSENLIVPGEGGMEKLHINLEKTGPAGQSLVFILARRRIFWAALAGALVGLGALTRYSFGWTIIPVVAFLVLFSGQRRVTHALTALGAFAILLTPWVVRNLSVSGTPFGTASFAAAEATYLFPQFQLERSVHPDFSHLLHLTPYLHKFWANGRSVLTNDLTRIAGSWATLLFWAGLLLSFRSATVRRMRYFLFMCLGTFFVVQVLGQTQLFVESPEVNSENLLVLLTPLIIMYGIAFFFTMLEQILLPVIQLRYAILTAFVLLSCLPMLVVLLPPKTNPVVYPPYYPPDIQRASGWMKENELMMSDVPWAVAWYGQRQCVWLTLDWQDEFAAIDNNLKPVQALYLTPQKMDGKFVSEWVEGSERSWGRFLLQTLNDKRVPSEFPLKHAPIGFLPERLFLTDRDRWTRPAQ